jgi:hypothetical protein
MAIIMEIVLDAMLIAILAMEVVPINARLVRQT